MNNTPSESKQDALWQPINTAPKDGTWILLRGGEVDWDHDVVRSGAVPPVIVGQYHPSYCIDKQPYWRTACYDGGWYGEYLNPTEWMPLPK